ncbi:MAG: GAF domain-containing protein [Cyanobacteriota bacterium]
MAISRRMLTAAIPPGTAYNFPDSPDLEQFKQTKRDLEKRNRELQLLHHLSQLHLVTTTLREAFQSAAAQIAEATEFPMVAIERYDAARQVMVFEGMVGIPMPPGISVLEVPVEETCSGIVVQQKQPFVKTYTPKEEKACDRNSLLSQLKIGTFVCIPMLFGEEAMGTLSLAHPQPIAVDREQLAGWISLANYLALLAHNKQMEEGLCQSHERYSLATQVAKGIVYEWDPRANSVLRERGLFELLGFREEEAAPTGDWWMERIHPEDLPACMAEFEQLFAGKQDQFQCEYRVRHRDGSDVFVLDRGVALRDPQGQIIRIIGNTQDIGLLKTTEQALQQQLQQTKLLTEISHHIRESLDLDQILNTTVSEVRSLLQTDRVIIFRFRPDWSGDVVTESVADPWRPILGSNIYDNCFAQSFVVPYQQGRVKAIEDIETAGLNPCHVQLLKQHQVRANLVVPILQEGSLWGLLIAHHCRGPRHWQNHEVDLLKHLADQVAIAIHQSQLYQQVRQLNTDLEDMVDERTRQLRQALEFESLVKGIIEKVRDSLNEDYILQTAVEELGRQLQIICCDTALYHHDSQSSTINHEYLNLNSPGLLPALGKVTAFQDFPDLYHQLLQGQSIQFCLRESPSYRNPSPDPAERFTVLSCPLQDEHQVLGDMWLYKPALAVFSDAEVRMIQQVANQCAIALRQARLYKASLAQVQELERLNQLKDDFLSTVSHELRSPMASIKMAAKMLSLVLDRIDISGENEALIQRYLSILDQECARETNLINDLLELSRLDANTQPLEWDTLNLQDWLPRQLDPFRERAASHAQSLTLLLPERLPPIMTSVGYLERLFTELLTNACKYTPARERITVSVAFLENTWQLQVVNTGVVIPPEELARVFDKFYRVPNNDPWKHGGTGLGLALSQKVAERLQGSLRAESEQNETRFILELPLTPV